MSKAITLKITKVIKETDNAVSIHFKPPFFKKIKYDSGQFLTLLLKIDGKIERRCYSLNSAPNVDDYVSVTVKRVKDGKVSNYIYNEVKVGDKIKALSPMGNFSISPDKNKKRHIVLFGAGSGITPLISILKSILVQEPKSHVSLLYGNRDVESIIFNNELNEYKKKFSERMSLIHILSNPGDLANSYKGRVERNQVPDLLAQLPSFPAEDTEYFICGPSGMMTEAEEGLLAFGVPSEKINIEKFSAPPPTAQEVKSASPMLVSREVKIIHKGKEHVFTVKAGTTILDAALDEKIKLPYVCMDGICGSCIAEKTSGEVFMRKGHVLTQKDLDNNKVLTCLCKPLTNNVVIEYS